MASTWQSVISSPLFNDFPTEKQNAVRRDYFSKYTTPEDLQIELERLSTLHGVDPSFSKAVATIESNWDTKAKSPKGASGIMQLMPPTAGDRAKEMGMDVNEVLSNPSFNMEAGVRHLKYLLNRYGGDTRKAAQAYNWGEGNLEKKGELAAPQETKDYLIKLEKQLGRSPTIADVPDATIGKKIVKPVEGEKDLEAIRNIDPNLFSKEEEPDIPLTYRNTEGKEVGEVPFIRGENKDNTFDIVTKPTVVDIPEIAGPPIPRKRDIPHPYEKYTIPSPVDIGRQVLGNIPEKGQKALGKGIQLLTGMNPFSAIPGSLAGQYIEDPTQFPSLTKAIANELVSIIPGSSGLIKGGLTGLAQSVLNSFIEKGQLPELEEALSSGMLGAFLGKFFPAISHGERGRHLQLEDKVDYLEPEGLYKSPQNVKDAEIVHPEISSRFAPPKEKKLPPLIDDTRPIGQSLTPFERKYVSPIEGKSSPYPQEKSPSIPLDNKREIIAKDPFNEKIATQFKQGRGRANEFGVMDDLEKGGVRNSPTLQEQSKQIAPLSKGHEFGLARSLAEETPVPKRILEPQVPTALTQVKDKIEALRTNPNIPLSKVDHEIVQARKDRLDEILSQYQSQLRGHSTTTLLPPGPPSHLAQVKKNIEALRESSIPKVEKPSIPTSVKKSEIKKDIVEKSSIPEERLQDMTHKKRTGIRLQKGREAKKEGIPSAKKEEGLEALRKDIQIKKTQVVNRDYIDNIFKHPDFPKYMEAARVEKEGIQAYQLASERLLTRIGIPREMISKVKSMLYEMYGKR